MDELNLYDDLDEFHEQQEKKSKELQEVEEKYQESLKTIEELRKENKTLRKNIRCIELGFQSLLDTARAEIRRKDKEIERLRKEKDDICFRRKTNVKSNTGENPHSVYNSAAVSNPFRCNIIKDNETTSKETTIIPKTSSVKNERPELHKRSRERDNEQNSSNDSKRYRSARDEKDEKYQHNSHEHGKHQQIIDDDKGGRARNIESIKETTYKDVDNRNRSRERDEYNKSNSRNIHEKSTKSSESSESYCRRSDRSISRERVKFNNKYKRFERNRSREGKVEDNFSKTSSKSPPRKNKYHKDFSRHHYKNDDKCRKTSTEKSLQPCHKDLTREKSKNSKDNNIKLKQEQHKFITAENSQKDKTKKNTNEKQNSEIGTVNIHNEHVEEEGHLVLKNKHKKSHKDLTNESSNDIQLEMIAINSNKSPVPEANKLSTPRKVALFNEIFGKSPCEGSTTATNSNSIINNVKGILAKSSEIEVISSVTTSPGDYTDLNSSMSTPASKTINVLKSDSNTSDSTVTENNYEKSVKHFQATRGEKDEIDKCFIPIEDEQRIDTNICIDLTKVVNDDIANELEFLQIPGLDLCPLWKETTVSINKSTLIEIEENENSKGKTETTINKVATEKSEKALKTRNTKIVEIVDIEAVKEQVTSDPEDFKVVDNIFQNNDNTENPIRISKIRKNINNFNVETENLVEISQKQNTTPEISNTTPNEKIFSKEDVEQTLKFHDISENLTNDVVIIETFKCGGKVPLKNPYNSYNTPPKNKQKLLNTEEEIFNVNETIKLRDSLRNDKMESINSITCVDDATSFDRATAKELSVEAATSYFSEKVPTKDNLLDIEIPMVADITTGAPKDVQSKENLSSFVEKSCDLLQKICSSNSNVNTTASNKSNAEKPSDAVEVMECEKLIDTAQETPSEKSSKIDHSLKLNKKDENDVITNPGLPDSFNSDLEKLKESKMPVKEPKLNVEESLDKTLNKEIEQIESAFTDDVHPKDVLQTEEQNLHQTHNFKSASNELNLSLSVERRDSTHLLPSEKIDKNKENHPFATVQASTLNLSEKSAFNEKQASVVEIVDPEISDNLIKNKEKYKEGQLNVKKATTEKKLIVEAGLNSPENDKAIDVYEAEAKVVRTCDPEQLDHLINHEKELKPSKSLETISIVEESLDKVQILENIQISKPVFTDDSFKNDDIQSGKTKKQNLRSYTKPNTTTFFAEISHTVDSKDLCKLETAEIPQSKQHKTSLKLESGDLSHLSEVDKIDKAVEVFANEFDMKKEELCEKETIEEAKSLSKETPNEIVKCFEENTSLTTTQETTSKSSEKSSNAFKANELNFQESQSCVTEVSSLKDEAVKVSGNETNYVRNTTTVLPDNGNSHEEKLESKLLVKGASVETKSVTKDSLTSPKDDQAIEASEKEANNVRITATGLPDICRTHKEILKESKSCVEEASIETKSFIEETSTSKGDKVVEVSDNETNNIRNTNAELSDNWNNQEGKFQSKSAVKGASVETKSIVEESITSAKDDEAVFSNNQEKLRGSLSNVEEAFGKIIPIVEDSLSAPKDDKAVEVTGEKANNKRKTTADCQSLVEEVSVETKIVVEETVSSLKEVHAVEVSGNEASNIGNTAAELQNKRNNPEETSVETESIVEESLTPNDEEVVEVSGKEANNVRITAKELADSVKNNEGKIESKSPVKGSSVETKPVTEETTSPKDDQAVAASEKEANNIRNTVAGLPDNVDRIEEALLETKSIEESLTSPKDEPGELRGKEANIVRNIAAELPNKGKSHVEEASVQIKSIVEESLSSPKDDQTVEVSGKGANSVKIIAEDSQSIAKDPSIDEESLDKIQTAVNIELSIPAAIDDSLSKGELQPVQTKEQRLFSSSMTLLTSSLMKNLNESELKNMCKLGTDKVLPSKDQATSLFLMTEEEEPSSHSLEEIKVDKAVPVTANKKTCDNMTHKNLPKEFDFNKKDFFQIKSSGETVSNEERSNKDSNLVKIADPEISGNLINNKEKAEDSQLHEASMEINSTIEESLEFPKDKYPVERSEKDLTVVRIIDQEKDLKECNTQVKASLVEREAVDAENLNKITESIKVPKQVPSDDLLNKDVLQTIEKTLIPKDTSSLGIIDTTCTIPNLLENKTNNSASKSKRGDNKEIIIDSTAKEKINFNSSDESITKIISTNISNNKIETIDSHSSSHNTDSFDEKSSSSALTKDNYDETAILLPCESVTLEAHIDESSEKMLSMHSKETTASYQNGETKTFLNGDSKGKTLLLDSCSSHDDKIRKTELNVAQTSQKALKEGSKNINLEQNLLDSAELKANSNLTDTIILDICSKKEISSSITEASVAEALTVANLNSTEKSPSKEINEQLASTINKVIEADTHIAESLHKASTAQGSTNNAKVPLKSCNLEIALKSIKPVDTAALETKVLEKSSIKNTTHGDEQKQIVVIENTLENDVNSKELNSLKDSQINIEGFNKIESKSSHEHSPVALENVLESINQEVPSPSEDKRQVKNLIEVETKSNDQLANSGSAFKIAAETKDLNENPSKLNKTQLCNRTFNPAEAIKICGNQLEVVLKPIKFLSSQTMKMTEKEFENSCLRETLTALENVRQPQIKKSTIKSSQKLTEQNQHNIQQKQISDFEGLIQSSVIFKNKGENQYVVINEQTEKDEPDRSITVLDKSVEVVKKLKSLQTQSANMFENVIHGQYNSVRTLNQVGNDFTAPKISPEHPAPSSFKNPTAFARNKKMKTSIKPKKVKETIQKTPVRSFEMTPEFSRNLNDDSATNDFKNVSKPMPRVLETDNSNIKISTKTHSKCNLETPKNVNISENKYEEIPVGFNISTATIQATAQRQEAVEDLELSKGVTVGEHNGLNKEPVSSPYDQILVYTPLQKQFISNKEEVFQRVINAKDIIIENNPEQSFNESLSMVPVKVINPIESLSLEKPQYIPDEMKNSNQTLKEKELDSFKLQPQITQNVSCGLNQFYEILPKPSLDIESTSALESNKNKFFKKIITKEINIEGEIVEVVKHIPFLSETQTVTESTDMNKQTIEPFINVGSCTKDEKTKSNRHNSNAERIQIPLTQANIVSNENNSLHSLDIQYQNTQEQQQQQADAFEMGVINNVAVEKEVSPTISLALPDTYNTIPVLPSISNTFPTPSNFSGIFSKKTSSTITADDEVIKSRKKSQTHSVKRKAYILPAASVLCNVDNLENATKPNKILHWELLNNENEMTEIEDDADIDATDDEQIKIKNEPFENVSSSSRQSSLQKRLTHQSSSSETETHTEGASLSNELRRHRTVKCQKLKHTKSHKIKLNKHKLPQNVAVRLTAIATHNVDTFADNGLLIQKPFSIDMPKRPVGRPRKLDKKARNNNEDLTVCHKKRSRKPKTTMENHNTQQEFPNSISTNDNNCEANATESLVDTNISENMKTLENSLKILSTSVEKLEICDESCSSRDSLKQTKSPETQIEEIAKKDASLIYHKESTRTVKEASVGERETSELPREKNKVIEQNTVPTSSTLERKQNKDINLNSRSDEDKAYVSADQPEQLALTDKIIDNNVVSLNTDIQVQDTQDHEVSSGNTEVGENCLLNGNDIEKPLLKNMYKSISVKNKEASVISLQDIDIKAKPPKDHISSFRIPKIKKNVEDGIAKSWNLQPYVELNNEADRQHLNKHAQSERKEKEFFQEKESSDVCKKNLNNEKVHNPVNQFRSKTHIETKIDTETDLNNMEKELDEVQLQRTEILKKDDDEISASNYVIKFDDNTKAGRRKLFSPDLYDASDTRANVEKELSETSYDQSECLSKIHETKSVKLRQKLPETKSVNCEVSSSHNSAGPRKGPKNVHSRILDPSCDEDNGDNRTLDKETLTSSDLSKKTQTAKFETNFEVSLKERTKFCVSNKPENKISCRDHEKTLYNEKVPCTATDTEGNKTYRSSKAIDDSKDPLGQQSGNLKLNEIANKDNDNQEPLTAIKSFKMRKKSCLKIISPDLGKLSNKSCTRASLQECGKLPNNKDGNKSIDSPLTLSKNLKETGIERKSIVSVKLRRKSVYVERNSVCNDDHEMGTTEFKKLKIVLEKKPEEPIPDKKQQTKPGSDSLIISCQQTSIITRRKSASLLNSNIVDKESQNIQDPKNDKTSEDRNSQQMDKVCDTTQKHRIMTRRKSTNQRRNLNISNKDGNSLNYQEEKKYSEESKQEAEKKTKNLRFESDKNQQMDAGFNCLQREEIKTCGETVNEVEILDTKIMKLNSQNYGENETDVGELTKITEELKESPDNFNSENVKLILSDEITKDTNEQKSCQQKLKKEKIEFDSKMENNHHMEIDSDSSIILTQQKAIQVRRKSTNQRRIFNSSSEDDKPLVKKPTVIPRDVQTALTTEAKPKQRRRRVVKVLSTSIKTTENERHISPLRANHPSPLESPTLNHPIFNREVSIQSTEFVASLPRTPNQQDDSKFKEIDSKLHEIFQSPQYSAEYKNAQGLAVSQATLLSPPLNGSQTHVTIDETLDFDRENNPSSLNISQANEPSQSLGDLAPILNNSEIKHLSLGSAEYRFEKVSDNVINLFISRKRKRKRNT